MSAFCPRVNDLDAITAGEPITVELLCAMHDRLLSGVCGNEANPGELRTTQNFIGSTPYIQDARYVHDLLKTYERLNATRTDVVQDVAHDEIGVPTASHYVAPGIQLGQNGTTHMDEFGRFGFSRAESATNQSYDDYVQFHLTGDRRWTITTFFDDSFILGKELENDPRLELFPPWRREGLLAATANNKERPDDPDCNSRLCRNVNVAKRIVDNGGLVVAGTDVPLTFNGVELHANLRPLVAYGFSEHEALLTATRFAAKHQDVEDDLGTIESGKLADMVFLDGNPLEDINNAMNVKMTMTDGKLYTIEDLLEPFSSRVEKMATEDSTGSTD